MAQIYRKSALEKMSSPEQLDQAIVITSPMSWLVLIGLTIIIAVTVIWSIVGTIPVTISAQGIIAAPVSTNAVYAADSGTVLSVLKRTGQAIHLNDEILSYRTSKNEVKSILSDQDGVVSEVMIQAGGSFTQGTELIRVSPVPPSDASQVVVCYIPITDARKVKRGMEAQVFVSGIDSQSYGHMVARVINVDSYAASNNGMAHVLGTDNNLAAFFQSDGPVVAVTCELYLPAENKAGASINNPYFWTNEKGSRVDVPNDAMISVKITTETVRPITKVFSKLKEIWGN